LKKKEREQAVERKKREWRTAGRRLPPVSSKLNKGTTPLTARRLQRSSKIGVHVLSERTTVYGKVGAALPTPSSIRPYLDDARTFPPTENTWLKALLVNGTPQPLDSPSPPTGPSGGGSSRGGAGQADGSKDKDQDKKR
jgi:hypothetical protein